MNYFDNMMKNYPVFAWCSRYHISLVSFNKQKDMKSFIILNTQKSVITLGHARIIECSSTLSFVHKNSDRWITKLH